MLPIPVALAAAIALWYPVNGSASHARAQADHLDIGTIHAVFEEGQRRTVYTLTPSDPEVGASDLTVKWTLALKAVDPDPRVGVDDKCINHGKLTGDGLSFVWEHGNIDDAIRDDGCDHTKMGKYGHQGLITAVVKDGRGWSCAATYKGTLSSEGNPNSDAASEQACSYTDPCEDEVETVERDRQDIGVVEVVREPLRKAALAALYELRRAEAELTELKRLGDPARVERAAANVVEAKAQFSKAVGTLMKWDNDDFGHVQEDLARHKRALADCRSRNDPPPAVRYGRREGFGRTSTDCTNERVALARAQGRADGYALLRPLAKIKLDPIARHIRTATAILQKASTTPKGRRLLQSVLGHLKAAGVSVKTAKSQLNRIEPGLKSATAAVAEARSNLAKCESGG